MMDARRSARFTAAPDYDGIFVLNILWGAWLIPFGYLVIRSGFLPSILGVLLILGGIGYIVDVFGQLLFSAYEGSILLRIFPRARRNADRFLAPDLWRQTNAAAGKTQVMIWAAALNA